MEMQRQEVIYDLLQTERHFVRRLRAMVAAFIVPLRVHASKLWLPGVPTPISRLLDWLEDILNLHMSLLRILKNVSIAWQESGVVNEVASGLLSLIPRLEVHQPYLVRVDEVRGLVVMWVQDQHSQFGEYIRLREDEGLCDGRSLEQCLQLPVQRLNAYLVVFKTPGGDTQATS
ncbi:Dbl homology domain-containing protein [Fomitopsis serialis]|uniref:Dbl homology domain-containing protein n=1 Tax=Fomitopsis serialis TaxID=139415 RepID=UPI002008180C|nr:Dbl homology domain-containing protein [Neoantrodia serialis]KAH9929179.1 Dbl homology domain-containing protein [Neoantrodia serialis]